MNDGDPPRGEKGGRWGGGGGGGGGQREKRQILTFQIT